METPGLHPDVEKIKQIWEAHNLEIRHNVSMLEGRILLIGEAIIKEVRRRVITFDRYYMRFMQTDELEVLRRSGNYLEKFKKSITWWLEDLLRVPTDDIKKGAVPTPDFDEMRVSDYEDDDEHGDAVGEWRSR